MQVKMINGYASANTQPNNFKTQNLNYSSNVSSNNANNIAFGKKCARETFELLNEILELLKNKHKNATENLTRFYKSLEESANIEINPEVLPKINHVKLRGKLKGEKLTFERILGNSNAIPEYSIKLGGGKTFRYAVLGPQEGHLDKVALDGRVKTVTSINNEEEQTLLPYLSAFLKGDGKDKAKRIRYFQIKS